MAFSHGRRLFELLEEKQEPFLLEIGLQESSLGTAIRSCSKVACGKLLRFISHGFNKRRWERRALGEGRRCVLNCFYGLGREKRDGGYWRRMEEPKQLSPVSVFGLHSDEGSSAQNHSAEEENPSTADEEPHLSTCFRNQRGSKNSPIQSERLALEHGQEFKEMISVLEKHRRDATRIEQLVDLDLSGAKREYRNFQAETTEIGTKLAELIFLEMREEVVVEMLGLLVC